jgi:tRNA pseudouridine13 synthase
MTDSDTSSGPRIRVSPEDFVVDEVPMYPPSGIGEHTFLRVEKRMRTTEEVARELARAAGVRPRDVGYAGRKDRVAVTRQWFSVPGLDPTAALALELVGASVLEAAAHRHKLRTGQLRGNRFELRVRGVSASHVERAQSAAEQIRRIGMPNRFGAQRFGNAGDNAERGRDLLMGKGHSGDRRQARFLLSALQSEVFNRVLAERPLPLDQLEIGDVALVTASGGPFLVEDLERENARAASFEISPSGPIFGTDALEATGEPGAREAAACAALGIPPRDELKAPRGIRLRGSRRPLRISPGELEMEAEGDVLRLCFELPRGAFATVLMEELGLQRAADG